MGILNLLGTSALNAGINALPTIAKSITPKDYSNKTNTNSPGYGSLAPDATKLPITISKGYAVKASEKGAGDEIYDALLEADANDWLNISGFVNPSVKTNKAKDLYDSLFSKTEDGQKLIKSKVSSPALEEFIDFRKGVEEAKGYARVEDITMGGYKSNKENSFLSTFRGVITGIPFAESSVESVSKGLSGLADSKNRLPTYRQYNVAMDEMADEEGYDKATTARTLGMVGASFGTYSSIGTKFDKLLLNGIGTTSKSIGGVVSREISQRVRDLSIKSPKLFALTSNSAQEAIEYGANKAIGNDNYSVSDLTSGLFLGAIGSTFSKKLDSVFDGITAKDLKGINNQIESITKVKPEASGKEIMDSIGEYKLDSGMKFGQLRDSFIRVGGKLNEVSETTASSISNFFRSTGNNITTGASKKLSEAINEVNKVIDSKPQDEMVSIIGKDIKSFKADLISELSRSNVISMKEVDELINRKSNEYGLSLKGSKGNVDLFDDAEELVALKGWTSIDDLVNPQSITSFMRSYLGDEVDYDSIKKIQDEIDSLQIKNTKGTNSDKIAIKEGQLKEILSTYNVGSLKELENMRYKINDDEVKSLAKSNRATGTKGKITNLEKENAREQIIKQTKELETKAEAVIKKMSNLSSSLKEGGFSKIVQFTQLKKGMENGQDYMGALRAFININSSLVNGNIAQAVISGGGKVRNFTKKEVKTIGVEGLRNKAISEGFDGFTYKQLVNGKEKVQYENINDSKFGYIDSGRFWVSNKTIEKQKFNSDLEEIVQGAKSNTTGKYTLHNYEDTRGFVNAIKEIYSTATLRNSKFLSYIDSHSRVFSRMFGEGTPQYKAIIGDIENGLSTHAGNSLKFMREASTELRNAGITNSIQGVEFSMAMLVRRGLNSRITECNNYKIDDVTGKIYNNVTDDFSKLPTTARQITDDDLAIISRKYSGAKYKSLINFLDSEFHNTGTKFNTQVYKDTGNLIDTRESYFPVNYVDTQFRSSGEDSFETIGNLYGKHIDRGFLNPLKDAPKNDFSIDLDIYNILHNYTQRQLYFLHMKQATTRSKNLVNGASTGIFKEDEKGNIILSDDSIGESSNILSNEAKSYYKRYITHVENRGIYPNTHNGVINNITQYSHLQSIVGNLFVSLVQFGSKLDSLASTGKKAFFYSLNTFVSNTNKIGDDVKAIKYSGVLASRQTNYKLGVSTTGGIKFDNGISSLQVKNWNDNLLGNVNNYLNRFTKRVDGEISTSVWTGYFYDYVGKNFPEVKWDKDLDIMRNRLGEDNFREALRYSDNNLVGTVGHTLPTEFSDIAVNLGTTFKLGTLAQKTFINRMLFLNNLVMKGGKYIPGVICAMGANELMEYEREYARTYFDYLLGTKNIEPGKDIDFGTFKISGDSHLGNLIANSRAFKDNQTLDRIAKGIHPDITTSQLYSIRAFGRLMSNTVYTGGGYDFRNSFTEGQKALNDAIAGKELPGERNFIQWTEVGARMVLPWLGDRAVATVHKLVLEEPLYQTTEDNLELLKMSADKNKLDNLNLLDFKGQANEAEISRNVSTSNKVISQETKDKAGTREKLIKELYGLNGIPTTSEFKKYYFQNKEAFNKIGITKNSQIDDFISEIEDYHRKVQTGEDSMTPKSIRGIYEYKLKALAEKGDAKGINDEIDRLTRMGIIKNKKSAQKDVKRLLKNDKLLGY